MSQQNEQVAADFYVAALNKALDKRDARDASVRESWIEVGRILNQARDAIGNNNQDFGKWIVANGFDKRGLESSTTRSNAMWLAALPESVLGKSLKCSYTNPGDIRKWCREQGYDWAHATERHEKRKATSERAKKRAKAKAAPTPRFNSRQTIENEFALAGRAFKYNGKDHDSLKLTVRAAGIDVLNREHEQRLREACREWMRANPAQTVTGKAASTVRETLDTEQLKQKFDRAVAKAIETETEVLRAKFNRMVLDKVNEDGLVAKARAKWDHMNDELEQERIAMAKLRKSHKIMNRAQYNVLLNVTHPDRPDRSKEKLTTAFVIVQTLEPFVGD